MEMSCWEEEGGADWFQCIAVGLCRSGLVHMEVCRLL